MSRAVLVPGKSGRLVSHKTHTEIARHHAVVVEVEHQAVDSQEINARRQERLGQETEITARIRIPGEIHREAGHRVGRAVRNCQHRVQRGEIAHRIGRVLTDTDNQIRIQRGVVARLTCAEGHLQMVHRQGRVEGVLQHSPCLTGAVQVEDTGQIPPIDVIRTDRRLVRPLEMPAERLRRRGRVMWIGLKILPPRQKNDGFTRFPLCTNRQRQDKQSRYHCKKTYFFTHNLY